jgi:Tfp pilus assembly PilM family ATPase
MFSKKIKSVGLNISDYSIKIVELKRKGKEYLLSSKSLVLLEKGVVDKGVILDKEKLKTSLNKAFSEASPAPIKKKDIIFLVPENLVFTHIFSYQFQYLFS